MGNGPRRHALLPRRPGGLRRSAKIVRPAEFARQRETAHGATRRRHAGQAAYAAPLKSDTATPLECVPFSASHDVANAFGLFILFRATLILGFIGVYDRCFERLERFDLPNTAFARPPMTPQLALR